MLIQNVMGYGVKVISSGEETASEVSTILYHSGLLNIEASEPEHFFLYNWFKKDVFKNCIPLVRTTNQECHYPSN